MLDEAAMSLQKTLAQLTPREVLALAILGEEEDARVYQAFAEHLAQDFPATASVFAGMTEEEREHRSALYALYRERFGEHLPPVRREDVKEFPHRKPVWWVLQLGIEQIRREAGIMEQETARFYERAATLSSDIAVRELFIKLAEAEHDHERKAERLSSDLLDENALHGEAHAERRRFVLQYVQPGLAGLMDGSVSTLAPLFAAAIATQSNWETFLVGLAASVGAGISMGFAEALSDDGSISGRGEPWIRGVVSGLMTALGGLGHTLPFLIPDDLPNAFHLALLAAMVVVVVELGVIAWIRARYMDTPFLRATFQVVVGGLLVFLSGILIGSA